MAKIFISHTPNNQQDANEFIAIILEHHQEHRFHSAYANNNRLENESVEERIKQSDIFLCLISDKYLQSVDCQTEFRKALGFKKPIIPIIVTNWDVNLAPQDIYQVLNVVDTINITTEPNEYVHQKLFQMIEEAQQLQKTDFMPNNRNSQPQSSVTALATVPSTLIEQRKRFFIRIVEMLIAPLVVLIIGTIIVENFINPDPKPEPTPTITPTVTPIPTNTPTPITPTLTPIPTNTPTPITPTRTPIPTNTPTPITPTPMPTPSNVPSAGSYLSQGLEHYNNQNYQDAIQNLERAIALDPNYTEAYYQLGLSYLAINDSDKARVYLGHALFYYKVNQHVGFSESEIHYHRGRAHHQLGNYEEAIKDFDEAIKLNDRFVDAYIERGRVYNLQNNRGNAFKDFNKAVELAPNNAVALANRAYTYYLQNKYDEAARDVEHALRIDSKNMLLYFTRGLVYSDLHGYDQAIPDFNRVIELEPDFAPVYYHRGNDYFILGNYPAVIIDYAQLLKLNSEFLDDPHLASIYYQLGKSYLEVGEYRQAIDSYTEAIRIDATQATSYQAYLNRASAYFHMGQYQLAIDSANRALDRNENKADTYYLLGNIYEELGDCELARSNYEEVTKLNPNYPLSREHLIWITHGCP
jgi:tetratricopeptide (TPR) repeat protein